MSSIDDLFECFDAQENESSIQLPRVTSGAVEKTAVENLKEFTKADLKRSHEENSDDESRNFKKQKDENEDLLLRDLNLEALNTRIVVHTLEAHEGCTHEVAVPPDHEYVPLVAHSGPPAKQYHFILDPFQKEAILCIDNNQSVLVSAHTSAGKTVTAEYAIALSLKNQQRVIYTTPIKALSNQKYREFHEEFHDVGLITGDVTINPTASCLIMTTEILRNMLYRGSEIMREVGWVIFDEIHYMRDKERGVVWEETLILLPDNVHYVFLSATIPNARQFAEWVCRLHDQPCHVVYTDYRPTPLQHYIFPAGGDGIHLVVDEQGQFKEDNFNTAMTVLANAGDAAKGDQVGRRGGVKGANNNQTNIFKIVKMIMERNFAPVIIFSFSKKECEMYAMQMAKLDFNTVEEKKLVDEVFNNAMNVLSEEDRKLPQVENVVPLLRRGIGIHHGGLLPILKETIEILFGEGLLKALFATETFAMGLNMPARTVVFTNCRKFDGKDVRFLTSGEYIQMSGRAGRRGLDDKGVVILMFDEKVSPAVGKAIVQGLPDPINSAFHLTYNMVLNLLRVEEINPEYMLERSFFQFQNQANIPQLCEKLREKQKEYNKLSVKDEHIVSTYSNIRQQLEILGGQFRSFITKPEYLKPFLQPGRLVKIKSEKDEYDWGIIVNFKHQAADKGKKKPRREENPLTEEKVIIVDVLLHVKSKSEESMESPQPCPPGEVGDVEVVPVLYTLINQISSLRVHYPKDLRPPDNRKSVLKTINEVKKRFPSGPPLLDPIKDMKIKEPIFEECVKKIEMFEERVSGVNDTNMVSRTSNSSFVHDANMVSLAQGRLFAHPLHKDPERPLLQAAYDKKCSALEELTTVRAELRKAKSLLQMEQLKKMKRVLRRMEYSTDADVIELKGRVACELNSADELLMTELIFNGVFNELTAGQCAALLSCFVCDENSQVNSNAVNELSGVLRQLQDLAKRIAKVSNEAKLEVDEESYLAKFKPHMMDVVLLWSKGASFLQLCQTTDIFEGSIIRCMRRLEEVLRQLCQAAKGIGNTDLEIKFGEAIKLLKRDIVFAASLYL